MSVSGHDTTTPSVDARVVRTRTDVLRAALKVLLDEGPGAVTHAHVAQVAGYSKATLYTHWPSRTDLIRDAFQQLRDVPHHVPTGDLRSDLIKELMSFRSAMEEYRLDVALATLASLTSSIPDLADLRDDVVGDGERVVRELLATVLDGPDLEATTLMLCGTLIHSALMHGHVPQDEVIETVVEVALRGVGSIKGT